MLRSMFRTLSFTVVVLLLTAAGAFAQQAGQIVGTVTDSSGAVVPGATVKAIEVGTGFTQSTIAGSDGQYVLVNLRPTQYEMTAEASGFRSFRRTGLELLANQSLTVNIALEVGAVTETVNISGAAVQVNTSNATISEVVDSSRIMDLVLNGRDVATLAALVPGMNVISVSRKAASRSRAGCSYRRTGRATSRSRTGWTAPTTPTPITRRTRASRSPTRCRSSRSRPATTRRRRATTRARW